MTHEAEFAEFVAARYRPLVRYGVSLVGDAGGAEDLVQEALVKTYRAWPRTASHPEAYTRRVMARAAWRAAGRWWRREVPTDPLPDRLLGDHYHHIDEADLVRRALRGLPGKQRVVLTLRFLDGLSESETAAVLGCPVGTVKSRCSRALAALRTGGLLDEEASWQGGESTG
jgi:RNA polymerase sigma-70 factor (sigma-E family)